ncbi:hypothetical protein GQ43DRAFT_73658 [Delitschia confertaspora ATCC 74209]|uniref:DM2 domain-containing protein n=1 Tax=Delitschia confertaspora ATCC 74209 TaxID=1513339 RepID=A0A9P4JJ86_9PLEO|nr:hypothetical protein GQ43DRAFT_73658 [Delitschia confertaspora ATCC 74209]
MQPQYRNYPPAAQAHRSSPHTTTSRRGPAPNVQNPHAQPHPAQIEASRRAEQERRERARRLTNHPTDKNIPEGVEELCIGDGVERYRALREVERKLDATMMRKKMDISDSVTRSQAPRYGTMRIWISNTAENQPWQNTGIDPEAFDFDSGSEATYCVKIAGRLLDDDLDLGLSGEEEEEKEEEGGDDEEENDPDAMNDDLASPKKKLPPPKPKMFSQFFKSITVDFDRAKTLQPDNFTQIEWKRPDPTPTAQAEPSQSHFSELVFTRKSDQNINITISLQRFDHPERYRLSPALSHLLDTDEDDRAGVMMGIWEYVKANHLQQSDDERKIACDANLKAAFNQDTLFFPYLPQLIAQHLHPLPPIELKYSIRVDKDYISPDPETGKKPSEPTIYDVQVPLDDPVRPLMHALFRSKDSLESLQTIHTLDTDIALLVRALHASKAKHAFLTSMAKDPVTFVKRWISSQKRDLEVMMGDAPLAASVAEDGGVGLGSEIWGSETARESVGLWLARRDGLKIGP